MAEKAIELDPQNAYARCWLAIIYFFRHENEGFRNEAQRALALNPNDPEILAEMGHYYSFLGEYDLGVELTRRAIILNPLHPGWYHFSFARKHLSDGDYTAAIADVRKINLPGFYWTWLIKASAFGHLGELESAQDSLSQLKSLVPGFSASKELKKWNAHPDAFKQIIKGLELAGYSDS
jgi:tetratricopeptide (TPR) repeat protein